MVRGLAPLNMALNYSCNFGPVRLFFLWFYLKLRTSGEAAAMADFFESEAEVSDEEDIKLSSDEDEEEGEGECTLLTLLST